MEIVQQSKASFIDQRWFTRLLQIIPGAATWLFLLSPVLLSFFRPVAVAYFIIGFDLLWLVKSFRISFYLIRGYHKFHLARQKNWLQRLNWVSDPAAAQQEIEAAMATADRRYRRQLTGDQAAIQAIIENQNKLNPAEVYNAVIIATYNESIDILEPSVAALTKVNYPLKQLMLVIAYEERGGEEVERNAQYLIKKYGSKFAYAKAIKHPDGIAGEVKGKGANISFAGRIFSEDIKARGIDAEKVIVTTFDSDHRPDADYFAYLTYHYCLDADRVRRSYQPIPMFYNNIWDVPAPMRVIATGNSFWMIIESMRPHRLRNFAAHAQSLQTLRDTDYWSVTSIVEDGHQYWRTYFTYDGDHRVVPLLMPVYQDAVLASGYLKTFKVQYLQLRRWAWGVTDFAYVVRNAIKHKGIPWSDKLVQIGRLFEGHFSWATAPLILSFAAWLPLLLNQSFNDQLLAHQLPKIASYILTLTMVGILVTVFFSLISLPPRPERYRRTRLLGMLAQWVLLPFTAIFFSAFAAIDAQTRLMLGKYMEFYVTEKATKK